ncbi:hypothetical protein DQB62_04095 [Shigella flexneri]|nr:hypothetical protein [Shigella flexneri]
MEKFTPDLSLTSLNMVISLVNHDLQLDLQENEVEVSDVKTSDEMDRDSTAIVKIKRPGNRTLQIYYNRLTAERWLNQQPILVKVIGEGFNAHDLIESVNAVCGANLQTDDLTDQSFTVGKDAVTLSIAPNSIAYKGQFSVVVFGPDETPCGIGDDSVVLTFDNKILTFGE